MRKLSLLSIMSLMMATSSAMVNNGVSEAPDLGLKLPCSYSESRIGYAELYHTHDGFKVMHDGELKDIHNGFVDKLVRNMDREQLAKFLGLDRPQIFMITKEEVEASGVDLGFEPCELTESDKEVILSQFGSGYLRLELMSDGEFTLKAFNGGLGGGPITGACVGMGVKILGYGFIALSGGPVGWGTAACGLLETAANGCVSGLLNKIAGGFKAAKAAKRAKDTAKDMRKCWKMLEGVRKVCQKSPTAKNLAHLAKLTAKHSKLTEKAMNATAKMVAIKATARATKLAIAKETYDHAKNGVSAGKAIKAGGRAALVPTLGAVNGVADVCQFICDFLPTP